jgi:hypothetical protein
LDRIKRDHIAHLDPGSIARFKNAVQNTLIGFFKSRCLRFNIAKKSNTY